MEPANGRCMMVLLSQQHKLQIDILNKPSPLAIVLQGLATILIKLLWLAMQR